MSSCPSSTTSLTFIGTSSVPFPLVSLPFSHRLLSGYSSFTSLLSLFLHYSVFTALFGMCHAAGFCIVFFLRLLYFELDSEFYLIGRVKSFSAVSAHPS